MNTDISTPSPSDSAKDPVPLKGFRRWSRAFLLSMLVVWWGGFVLVAPLIGHWYHQQYRSGKILPAWLDHPFSTLLLIRTVEWFAVSWFFFLGAAMGSFLHVVAWRSPQSLDIVFRPSRCPGCGKRLTFRENLPIAGWCWLQGSCRYCHASIPARYVLAETGLGLAFLALAVCELLSGGLSLPNRTPNSYAGVLWVLLYTKWDLVTFYVYHATLIAFLFVLAWTASQGWRIPYRLIVLGLAFPLVFLGLFPWLFVVPVTEAWIYPLAGTGNVFLQAIVGGGVGLLIGRLWCALRRDRIRDFSRPIRTESWWSSGMWYAWPMLGVALGWQAVVSLTVVMWTIGLILAFSGVQRKGVLFHLLWVVTTIWLCGWRYWVS